MRGFWKFGLILWNDLFWKEWSKRVVQEIWMTAKPLRGLKFSKSLHSPHIVNDRSLRSFYPWEGVFWWIVFVKIFKNIAHNIYHFRSSPHFRRVGKGEQKFIFIFIPQKSSTRKNYPLSQKIVSLLEVEVAPVSLKCDHPSDPLSL